MAASLADDVFKCIFLNENVWISLKISLKFAPKVRINNMHRIGDKPVSKPMLTRFTDAYMRHTGG